MPTNIYPSTVGGLGNGTIDATDNLTVSWQVNGSSALTAFSITIYENNANSTQKYTTGKLTDGCPFYGTNYQGEVQFFSYTIASSSLQTAGIVNGKEYKLIIQQWWSDTDSITQVSAAAFITRATPTLALNGFQPILDTNKTTFTATYAQAQGDGLMWVRWQVAAWNVTASTPADILLDTGNIYGTSELKCFYDGFFTGQTYAVKCTVETQNGIQADTGWKTFLAQYTTTSATGLITAQQICGHSGVYVSWSGLAYIPGVAPGSQYTIENGKLTLSSGSVQWNTVNGIAMSLDKSWSVAFRGRIDANTAGAVIFSLSTKTLWFRFWGTHFELWDGTQLLVDIPVALGGYVSSFILTPNKLYIEYTVSDGGLYPANTLYPSTGLYPRANSGMTQHIETVPVQYIQEAITAITLSAPLQCDYLWVTKGTLSEVSIDSILNDPLFEPVFDANTYLLADFNNGFSAGNIPALDETITGFSIYRRSSEQFTAEHIVDLPISETAFADFGVRSQRDYQYLCFPYGENTFVTTPFVSSSVKPCFWNWTLMECSQQADGSYHILNEYRFGLNLSTGSMSNNNAPQTHINFTPYPLIQPMSANYKSGSLSSLIGATNNGEYSDTIELREAIYALSVTQNPLFLKSRKGDLMQVKVSGAINMSTIDNTKEQVQQMELPWAEVGDTQGKVIVSTAEDSFWPKAQGVSI